MIKTSPALNGERKCRINDDDDNNNNNNNNNNASGSFFKL
jgi:hypothetical protein